MNDQSNYKEIYDKGVQFYSEGKFTESISEFEKCLKIFKHKEFMSSLDTRIEYSSFLGRGMCKLNKFLEKEGLADLLKAKNYLPKEEHAYIALFEYYYKKGDKDQMNLLLKEVDKNLWNCSYINYFKSMCFYLNEKVDDAKKCIDLIPDEVKEIQEVDDFIKQFGIKNKPVINSNININYIEIFKNNKIQPKINTKLLGDELEKGKKVPIGEGGFGNIFRYYTKNDENGKTIIKELKIEKMIKQNRDKSIKEKAIRQNIKDELKKEINLLCDLEHTNIVKLTGFDETNYEIKMNYELGGDLANTLRKEDEKGNSTPKKLSEKFKLYLIKEIANGIAYIHSKGKVHSDLKTDNILLSRQYIFEDEGLEKYQYPTPKISDFGLGDTIYSKLHGYTLNYAAPEIFVYGSYYHLHPKSDVYSFIMVAYEIISQKRPYDWLKECGIDIKNVIINQSYKSNFIEVVKNRNLKDLFEACLQYDPANRPSMQEVVERLKTVNSL